MLGIFTIQQIPRVTTQPVVLLWATLNRLAFCNAGNGSDGTVYIQSATEVLETGYLQTGFIRYNTLENKIFKLLQARVDTTNGS
jgi:hypothetical protein